MRKETYKKVKKEKILKRNSKSNKINSMKGITLIALIVTIIVLLILVGVTIATLTGENGIITRAIDAKTETAVAEEKEAIQLAYAGAMVEKRGIGDVTASDLNTELDINGTNAQAEDGANGEIIVTFELYPNRVYTIDSNGNISETGITIPDLPETGGTLGTVTGTETSNTTVEDSLGNKVVVPAGFKVVNLTDNVENGIVIEDVSHGATAGSQFVWIPVGTIHTSSGDKTITLGRYVFNSDGTINTELSKTEPTDQLRPISDTYYYTEGLKDSSTTNTHAKDITDFISKTNNTGGYYIGRYEARDGTTDVPRTPSTSNTNQLVCTASNFIYNHVSQAQAASLSQEMYAENNNFTSDLVNSYAWDTAIVFIQNCSDQINYANQTNLNDTFEEVGTIIDNICNIYDMSSNCFEWTTETAGRGLGTIRGGDFSVGMTEYTSDRFGVGISFYYQEGAFRPILYL